MRNSILYTKSGILRLRWWVASAGLVLLILHIFILVPYEVRDDKGVCLFVVSPTNWNEGKQLPCGSFALGSIPVDRYY